MQKSHSISGIISSLSHVFRLEKGPLSLIELQTESYPCYIVLQRPQHFSWLAYLEPGLCVNFIDLKRTKLYKDHKGITFKTTSSSSWVKVEPEINVQPLETNEELISYSGVITNVYDEALHIFEVDGEFKLLLTYLVDVTADFSSAPSEHYIEVGDAFTLYHAHIIQKGGTSIFVACSRSYLKLNRKPKRNYVCVESSDRILHCIHTFNFGLNFLEWLTHLKSVLSSMKNIQILKNDWKSIETEFFCKLVMQNKKICRRKNVRSLIKEFLEHSSNCVISKEFVEPFSLHSVNELVYKSPNNVSLKNAFWDHSREPNERKFIIGHLNESDIGGYLKLECESKSLDVVFILRENSKASLKTGIFIIPKFIHVCESLKIDENLLTKEYLLVEEDDIILVEQHSRSLEAKGGDIFFKIVVILKTGLNFYCPKYCKRMNPFFFGLCHISKISDKDSILVSNKSLIYFSGEMAKLFPFLRDGSVILGSIPFNAYNPLDFKRRKILGWLPDLDQYFDTNEVIYIPQTFTIHNISYEQISNSILSASDSHLESSLRSFVGWVRKRIIVAAKFSNRNNQHDFQISSHICIPRKKNICLLIEEDSSGRSTWVYLDFNQSSIPLYPLGLIPNVKVHLTCLRISKSNSHFFKSTPMTDIKILEYNNDHDDNLKFQQSECTIAEAQLMPAGTIVNICCSVSSVQRLVFKIQCPSCKNHMINGTCSYVGCHSNEEGICGSFASISIDDGVSTALLFVNNPDLLRIVLNIGRDDWDKIHNCCSHVTNGKVEYSAFSKGEKNHFLRILDAYCNSSLLIRPISISARIFPNSSNGQLELFCLNLYNYSPT